MDDKLYALSKAPGLALPAEDVEKLLCRADGCCALLYLYILRHGRLDTARAARDLKRTAREIETAAGALREMGLLAPAAPAGRKLPAPDELPEYTAQEVSRRSGEDTGFQAVVAETQRTMGRMLSGAELKTLLGIYDYLGLPAEVILLLVNHCVEEFRTKYGPGRLPTLRRIEKEAYVWANREILTLRQAEEYLQTLADRRSQAVQIKTVLQIRDRELTPTEGRYVDGWLDMGFPLETLEIAYDKTVVKTGRLQWKYMDSILQSWHGKGLHTPEEIAAGDGRPAQPGGGTRNIQRAAGSVGVGVPGKRELEQMERLIDRMNRR
jgi:hypothetical protein